MILVAILAAAYLGSAAVILAGQHAVGAALCVGALLAHLVALKLAGGRPPTAPPRRGRPVRIVR